MVEGKSISEMLNNVSEEEKAKHTFIILECQTREMDLLTQKITNPQLTSRLGNWMNDHLNWAENVVNGVSKLKKVCNEMEINGAYIEKKYKNPTEQ